ncbi:MAG: helix-turn-helix transcriptional regulator [Lentisphaerae bacterium]|nr:helix-turn-helix transcriptional regulator [Lentisphaerota bacterium]
MRIFPDRLWTQSVTGHRGGEWSALYADTHTGPRTGGPLARHDFWELSVVLHGEGEFLGPEPVSVRARDCILAPPGIEHNECSRDEDFRTLWIGFRTRVLKPSECLRLNHQGLADMAQDLWLFSREQGKAIGPELDARTAELILRFLRLHTETESRHGADRVSRAIDYLETNYIRAISVKSLARDLNCSEGYLHRCFKKRTGSSPAAYLQALRIRQACFLLRHTRLTICEIGERCGYPDPAHFSRIFKNTAGKSPRAFRLGKITDSGAPPHLRPEVTHGQAKG